MVNRVIIVDAHRANERIPFYELKQMMGRVSRGSDTEPGKVDFVLGATKYDKVVEDVQANQKYQVKSTLAVDLDELGFYVVAEISRGSIKTVDDIQEWYKRSLSYAQGVKIDVPKIIELLKNYGSIIVIGNKVQATILGHASARYYLYPQRIHSLYESFKEILDDGQIPNTFSFAWALTQGDRSQGSFEPKEIGYLIEEYKSQLSSLCLDGTGKIRRGIIWWYLLGGPGIKSLKGEAMEVRKEWPRLYKAIRLINYQMGWPHAKLLSDLDVRICNRLPEELVQLCRDGFTKTSASELYNMDIKCYNDLHDRLMDIYDLDNPVLTANVKRVIDEHNLQFRPPSFKSVLNGDGE